MLNDVLAKQKLPHRNVLLKKEYGYESFLGQSTTLKEMKYKK